MSAPQGTSPQYPDQASAVQEASTVSFAGERPKPEPATVRSFPRKAVAVFAIAVLLVAGLLHKLTLAVLLVYGVMSGIAFLAYGFDKSAAQNGQWPTPETTLHAFALFGGWPGALLAQGVFHHKSRKAEFQVMFWTTVAMRYLGRITAWNAAQRATASLRRTAVAIAPSCTSRRSNGRASGQCRVI